MLKSLRRKFILVNMALVFAVLAIVFTALGINGYRMAVEENLQVLRMVLDAPRGMDQPKFQVGKPPPENHTREPVFVIFASAGMPAEVLHGQDVSLSQAEADEIMAAAAEQGQGGGVLGQYNLRFLSRSVDGGLKVACIDRYAETQALRRGVISGLLAVAAAMAAFFVVSLFLSRWALKPVEQAWNQQSRFVADASHELKTPLTVILANTGILRENRHSTVEAQMAWIDNTETEAKRMRRLVDDMLLLSKAENTGESACHTQVDFADVVTGTALAFEALAYERNLQIDASGVESGVFVKGDAQRLRQLVGILVDNGIKYSKTGENITVRLEKRQGSAILEVFNKGQAIPKQELERIFDRFYRVDKSRSTEGYGLGLAIARSIVKAHGGKISAESRTDGTIFAVSLPIWGVK